MQHCSLFTLPFKTEFGADPCGAARKSKQRVAIVSWEPLPSPAVVQQAEGRDLKPFIKAQWALRCEFCCSHYPRCDGQRDISAPYLLFR